MWRLVLWTASPSSYWMLGKACSIVVSIGLGLGRPRFRSPRCHGSLLGDFGPITYSFGLAYLKGLFWGQNGGEVNKPHLGSCGCVIEQVLGMQKVDSFSWKIWQEVKWRTSRWDSGVKLLVWVENPALTSCKEASCALVIKSNEGPDSL